MVIIRFKVMFISHMLESYNTCEWSGINPITAIREYHKSVNTYRNCHNCHVELNFTIRLKSHQMEDK